MREEFIILLKNMVDSFIDMGYIIQKSDEESFYILDFYYEEEGQKVLAATLSISLNDYHEPTAIETYYLFNEND
jgi:hypothetical protein